MMRLGCEHTVQAIAAVFLDHTSRFFQDWLFDQPPVATSTLMDAAARLRVSPHIVSSRTGTFDTAWALERAHCILFSYNLQARFLFLASSFHTFKIQLGVKRFRKPGNVTRIWPN
jgi:hypothetical protein